MSNSGTMTRSPRRRLGLTARRGLGSGAGLCALTGMGDALMTLDGRRAWSRQYDAAFTEIIRLRYGQVRAGTQTEDMRQATDLVLETVGGLTVQARVRSAACYPRYRYDYTIRVPHELAAITQGYCDVLLYGFAAQDNNPRYGLRAWTAIDLAAFRAWWTPARPYHPIVNAAPPHGRAYNWRLLPSSAVHHEPDWAAVRLPV